MKRASILGAVLAALWCAGRLRSADQPGARAWQDTLQLPTYDEGSADPNPEFAAFASGVANYPYALRRNFTNKRSTQTWRTLNLENEYLFCRVMPDLGGHVYNCRDKRSGREVFYANPVVKKADVGLRGAWVAMGIEPNFPIGHARDSVSGVDSAVRANPDGSATVVVEQIERVTGMQWRVEYTLRPGSAALESHVVLYNRSLARRPYSWWANAGVALDDPAERFILPSRLFSVHGAGEIESWPVASNGRNESLIAGHKDGVGWFAYGSQEPFFAVYKPASRSGVAHFADAEQLPGKKLWLWGADGDKYVQKELTDAFPSYVEIQAGVTQNQDTFAYLEPEQFKAFTEYWIPVYDLGGVSRVTRDAVVNLERRTGSARRPVLAVEIGATRAIPNASVRLLQQGRPVFETRVDLNAGSIYKHELDNPAAAAYTVQLADSGGAVLAEHTEGVYNALSPDQVKLGKQPETALNQNEQTEAFWAARGNFDEQRHVFQLAEQDYSTGLQKFPASVALQKAKGRLALGLNRFQEAADLLTRVKTAAPSDDEAAYLLGATQVMLGRDGDARQTLAQVPASSAYRRAATLQLALISARAKDFPPAIEMLKPILADRSGPVRAGAIEIALLRHAGRKQDALGELAAWQSLDPADAMLRFERILLGAEDDELWTHLGQDAEWILNLVDEYLSLGFYDDALILLKHPYKVPEKIEPGVTVPWQSAVLTFYRFFCKTAAGEADAPADLRLAAGMPMLYAFPYRASSFRVFQAALAAGGSDPTAHFLMGRLYMHALMVDEAIAQWQAAAAAKPRLPELYRDLARALAELKHDPSGASLVLREALKTEGNSDLRTALEHVGDKLALIPGSAADPPAGASPLQVASAALLRAAAGNVNDALTLFKPEVFKAEKQPDEVRRAYIELRLQSLVAQARSKPGAAVLQGLDRLGGEDPNLPFTFFGFDPYMKDPHFQYYMGVVEDLCKQDKDARKRWAKVGKMDRPMGSPDFAFPFLASARVNLAEAKLRIERALESVRAALAKADGPSKAGLMYNEAMLLRALGQNQAAAEKLQAVVTNSENATVQNLASLELRQILTP